MIACDDAFTGAAHFEIAVEARRHLATEQLAYEFRRLIPSSQGDLGLPGGSAVGSF